jgi:hypothetical protein
MEQFPAPVVLPVFCSGSLLWPEEVRYAQKRR